MKNIKVISGMAVLAIIVSVLIFNSCTKQELTDKPVTEKQEVKMSDEDIAVYNKITSFKQKLEYIKENPGYKSGEVIETDSAIWLMEALFNYTYGFPDELYNRSKSDTGSIVLQLDDNGYVDLDEVNVRFIELTDKVREFYYNSGFEERGLILTSLVQQSLSGNEVILTFYSITGEKGSNWDPFEPGDDWWYGHDDGKCYNIPGSDTTDAAELIEIAINNNKPLVYPPPGYRFLYIPDDPITITGDEYPNPDSSDPDDNYTDYLIFYCTEAVNTITEIEECLEYEEMNFHFHGEENVIYDILPEEFSKPTNWAFINCDLNDKTDIDDNGFDRIRHESVFNYGYRHLLPLVDPRIEL